jgi:Flp pilus assembly pilin Flp
MIGNWLCNHWLQVRSLVANRRETRPQRSGGWFLGLFGDLSPTAPRVVGVGLALALGLVVEGNPMGYHLSNIDSHSTDIESSKLRQAWRDTRGAVLLEYSIIVGTVALAGAVGFVIVGIAVLNSFGFVRELLLSAIP